ncbi:MAG: hypothetical protein RW306_16030, partial [Geobacteraceae bacterium]|nr:hypothetical protein [Geobacteraceae bacterium]
NAWLAVIIAVVNVAAVMALMTVLPSCFNCFRLLILTKASSVPNNLKIVIIAVTNCFCWFVCF